MTDRRRFQVVPPDWGEAHLNPEAVVAYVDGELAAGPLARAERHLRHCTACTDEVAEQRRARSALRGADAPTLPPSLMTALRSIPRDAELPPPPAGLAVTGDGELVSVLRPGVPPRTGPDDGAAIDAEVRSRRSRRVRLGTGAAVSGLALGALAFGLPAAGPGGPAPVPAGPAPGAPVMARLAVTPAPPPARPRPSAGPSGAPVPAGSGAPVAPGDVRMRNAGLPPERSAPPG